MVLSAIQNPFSRPEAQPPSGNVGILRLLRSRSCGFHVLFRPRSASLDVLVEKLEHFSSTRLLRCDPAPDVAHFSNFLVLKASRCVGEDSVAGEEGGCVDVWLDVVVGDFEIN
jgi:hypothetical protein